MGLVIITSALCTVKVVEGAYANQTVDRRVAGWRLRTRIRHYTPFTPSGAIAIGHTVVAADKGFCALDPMAVNRARQFECFGKRFIYSDCFADWVRREVACLQHFNRRHLVLIHLSRPLGKPLKLRPYAMELVIRGAQCFPMSGATNGFDYMCTNGLWLYGDADTRVEPWRIPASHNIFTSHPKEIQVRVAWFYREASLE